MSDFDDTVDAAYKAALDSYKNTRGGFPAGFAWIKNVDGRSKTARALKADARFNVRSAADSGSILHINILSGQSLDPKSAGYRAFLRTMKDAGYLEGATLYTRWD